MLRRSETDRPTRGRVSIAALVSLADQRRRLEQSTADLAQKTRELVVTALDRQAPPDETISPELLEELQEEVSWRLAEARELDAAGELTMEERQLIAPFREWRLWEEAISVGEERIAAAEERIEAEVRDKLVFVGMTATASAADVVHTPLGAGTPGVVAHAVVADMVLSGRRLRLAPAWSGWALAALLGSLCTLLAARLTPLLSTLVVLSILAGYVLFAGWWIFGSAGGVLPLVAPLAAGSGAWIGCTALEAALFQRDRRRLTQRFKTRVSPQLVDYLLANPDALSVMGEQREITVMFLDLAGFTAMIESMEVPVVVAALNRCLGELTNHIAHHQGYVNKFLGDGLMAFWSAFRADPEQATRACTSALECQAALERLNRSQDFAHLPSFSARIGIATGRVIVGDCGAPPQLNDYTVIGNDINLASRLESANKQFDTGILITERTREQLGSAHFQTRPIGNLIVVGQTVPVRVHELLPPDADPALIEMTTRGVEAFMAGDHEASAAVWRNMTEVCGPTKLAEFYLAAIADPDAREDGAVRLQEK